MTVVPNPSSPTPPRPTLLYIVGIPGSGKTTLMAQLWSSLAAQELFSPIKHVRYSDRADTFLRTTRVIQLGFGLASPASPGATVFAGTDTLPLNVQPKVLNWLALWLGPTSRRSPPLFVAEGDRLANGKFFSAVRSLGYALDLVWLDTPEQIAWQRRLARATAMRTSLQDVSWVKGRITKVRNLVASYSGPVMNLDGTQSVDCLVASMSEMASVRHALRV